RLDSFLGQARQAERQKAAGKKASKKPDELLALAMTGWLLGSPSAEASPDRAASLWKTRRMMIEYLLNVDADDRKKGLAAWEKATTPRIEVDELCQMAPLLTPVDAAKEIDTKAQELKAGNGRAAPTYHVQLPPEYTHSRPYPVMIVLHNAGEKPVTMLERW